MRIIDYGFFYIIIIIRKYIIKGDNWKFVYVFVYYTT